MPNGLLDPPVIVGDDERIYKKNISNIKLH